MSTHHQRAWLLAPLAILMTTVLATSGAKADGILAGSQGTDTSLPATASQVTVKGRGTFADLTITVNQTANLTNQAVSITWTGGTSTVSGPGRFGGQYLQIMQCWGDDDGTVQGNPGPQPEQCEQGAVAGSYGGLPGGLYPSGFALSRVISRSSWTNFDASVGHLDPRTTNVWLPFRAVDGTVVNVQTDPTFNPSVVGGNFWLNPYFNQITTNEIAGAATGPDGRGAELFSVVNGVESSGLGCGQRTQPVVGSDKKTPLCWIVIVPRGAPADENAGTPFETNAEQAGVVTSPVSPEAWKHRIAIPVTFNPVDSPCALGVDERRISGSELALPAISSWQPSLCATGALPPYSYASVSDGSARQQLVSGQPGSPGMVVVSRPLDIAAIEPAKPVVYAPVSVSGLVIGFNIERNPTPDAAPAEQQLAGVRIADLSLTPRLVAKLLTQSYAQAVTIQQAPPYAWLAGNPANMSLDPDFRQFNPEFDLLQVADGRTFSGLQLPAGNSDAAQQVWQWVLADPEARAWLDGAPDKWGMRVNPVYATTASANSRNVPFGDPLPSSFPKADPYCYQAPAQGPGGSIIPPALCGTDWLPYVRSFAEAARVTRAASDGARIIQNPFALSSSDVWSRELPQFLGRRGMLALTDTPSAAQFGLQTARLSRSGDNGVARTFVAPDAAGLISGVASMAPAAEPTFLEPSPTTSAPGAYPLTSIAYAAVSPLALSALARSEYASFLDYAAGPGQVSGLEVGQLPRGYAPLPATLKAQSAKTASEIRTMVATPVEPTTVSTNPGPSTAVTTTTAPPTTTTSTTAEAATMVTNPVASTAAQTDPPNTSEQSHTTTQNPGVIGGQTTRNAAPPTTVRRESPTTVPRTTTPPTVAPAPTTEPTSLAEPTTVAASTTPVTILAAAPTSNAAQPTSAVSTTAVPGLTPKSVPLSSRFAVPGLGVAALGSALCALEITKRPRRRRTGPDGELDEFDDDSGGFT